jgi:SAM-dependent methyltransferase
MKNPHKFDFTRALARGHVSYDARVGQWWEHRAADAAHARAYRHSAEHVRDSLKKAKVRAPLIVDYACGGGHFLLELAKLIPDASIVGLDGSKKLLTLTAARCEAAGISAAVLTGADAGKRAFNEGGSRAPRIRLVQTRLPNFNLPAGRSDAVAFVFPNIAPGPADQPVYDRNGYLNRNDAAVAKMLARFREMDPEDEVTKDKPEVLFDGYMTERVLSRNMRRLLKPKGLLFKVDYANALRSELTELSQWRCLFAECALEAPIKGLRSEVLFKLRGNVFRRSSVILDVYHQTKDPSDKTGGYFITEFSAV